MKDAIDVLNDEIARLRQRIVVAEMKIEKRDKRIEELEGETEMWRKEIATWGTRKDAKRLNWLINHYFEMFLKLFPQSIDIEKSTINIRKAIDAAMKGEK